MPNVAAVTPIICGSIRRPDWVGETNSESWKYSGRNWAAPYVTTPAHIPSRKQHRTMRLVNRRNGIIGSGARCSTEMNSASAAAATANRTSTCRSVQPSRPSSRPIIRLPMETDSSAAPA